MLKNLLFAFRFFCFWLIYFFIDRLVFILYFSSKLQNIPFTQLVKAFVYGLWMDASMAGYICVIPLVFILFLWLAPKSRVPAQLPKWYTHVLIILFSFITIVNFNIYREWGSKINYRAIDFAFNSPNEAFASSVSSPVVASFVIFFILIAVSLLLSKLIIDFRLPSRPAPVKRALAAVLLAGLTFLAIRGGWQLSPMNESMAYYTDKPILNHAAINTEWSLMRDVLSNKYGNKNPYLYYKPEVAKKMVSELYQTPAGGTSRVLKTDRPNVVLIIMESFTADVVESLGGEKNVAPQMEKLISEGLLFTHIYASGDRTDKGIIAILSAFPSQAVRSIIKFNGKQERLPALAQVFSEQGYRTSFYYGGESEFFNVKSYVLSHAYQRLTDKPAFNSSDMNSKWGAYDHAVYARQLTDMAHEQQPFFSTIQTLTNHEPFELPGTPRFAGDNAADKFRSTAFYADSSLADYLNKAKKQAWYKNTLFIIVSDHGHLLPKNKYDIYDPHRFRIPLLFYGDALKPEFTGKKISKTGNQTDIAATLLTQLNLSSGRFKWSKDLLNSGSKEFSFYDWDNGFGFVSPQQSVSFDNIGRHIIYTKDKANRASAEYLTGMGKAYMQTVFQEYLDY